MNKHNQYKLISKAIMSSLIDDPDNMRNVAFVAAASYVVAGTLIDESLGNNKAAIVTRKHMEKAPESFMKLFNAATEFHKAYKEFIDWGADVVDKYNAAEGSVNTTNPME